MKAVYVTDLKKAEVLEIDRPRPAKGEVLIAVKAMGICGSDLHVYLGLHAFRKPPVVLGHELSGIVCEIGEGVTKFRVGDRVTVNPSVSCKECDACKRGLENICDDRKAPGTGSWLGAFVEYFPTPEETVYKISDTVDFPRAALTEPLSVAEHVFGRISVEAPKSMAILGCGTIGLMILYLAKRAGIETILCSDPAPYNRTQALAFGAKMSINPLEEDPVDAARRLTGGEGVDVCIVAASAPNILNQASLLTRKGGEIGLVAMITKPQSFDSYSIVFREQRVFGSQISQVHDFEKALSIVEQDPELSKFITQRMPAEEIQHAMALLSEKKGNVIKIILEWR